MKSKIYEHKKINFKMVSKNNFLLLLITFSLFGLVGCTSNATQNDPVLQLPPETQTGANTFGCYINGKLLVPRSGIGTVGGSDTALSVWGDVTGNQQYSEIDARDYKSNRTAQILIHIQNLHQIGIGIYIIDISNGMRGIDGLNNSYIHCRVFNESTNSHQYYRSFNSSGSILITKYDFANEIISGTFTCRLRNSINQSDEIQITQGRFDINPRTVLDKTFP